MAKTDNIEKTIKAQLAEIVESTVTDDTAVAVPEGFEGGREVSSFASEVKFNAPGDYVAGFYKGMKEDVGPNHSKLYLIELPGGNKEVVGVWGSTVLDSKMLNASPRVDAKIMIQRLEDIASTGKGNPPKNFRVLLG